MFKNITYFVKQKKDRDEYVKEKKYRIAGGPSSHMFLGLWWLTLERRKEGRQADRGAEKKRSKREKRRKEDGGRRGQLSRKSEETGCQGQGAMISLAGQLCRSSDICAWHTTYRMLYDTSRIQHVCDDCYTIVQKADFSLLVSIHPLLLLSSSSPSSLSAVNCTVARSRHAIQPLLATSLLMFVCSSIFYKICINFDSLLSIIR